MKILFIGDIFGRSGRRATKTLVPVIVNEMAVDFVIANGENAAGGFGLTGEIVNELLSSGIDVITSGNHIWDKKEIYKILQVERRLLRPANYPGIPPGRGCCIYKSKNGKSIGVVNLEGRVFMSKLDCPFRAALTEISKIADQTNIIIVDFHAEATSEKRALGWYLDGKVSAVLCTHTHVQTSDESILPKGTGYLTDAGLTGGTASVVGVKKELAIEKFLNLLPIQYEASDEDIRLQGAYLEIDNETGRCVEIKRIDKKIL
jgi:hypothetical protein